MRDKRSRFSTSDSCQLHIYRIKRQELLRFEQLGFLQMIPVNCKLTGLRDKNCFGLNNWILKTKPSSLYCRVIIERKGGRNRSLQLRSHRDDPRKFPLLFMNNLKGSLSFFNNFIVPHRIQSTTSLGSISARFVHQYESLETPIFLVVVWHTYFGISLLLLVGCKFGTIFLV